MSGCESPFTYTVSGAEVSTSYTTSYNGNYTLPGYSLPSTELCLLGCNPGGVCNCHSCGWHNWDTCCDWCKNVFVKFMQLKEGP